MSNRRGAEGNEPTWVSAGMPTNQFMTLYQRYDSLRNSIALLREQILHTPGIEDWLSVQNNYINIMSHVYSIAAALQSPSPHFVASQIAALNEFLDSEARDAELFGDEQTEGGMPSLLYGREGQDSGLPPIEDHDPKSRLPDLAVHPCLPIPDRKLNWLGTLLRTVPEAETSSAEAALIEDYDCDHSEAMNEVAISKELEQHDERSIQALRSWYHLLHAPDEDGNTFDFTMRIETET